MKRFGLKLVLIVLIVGFIFTMIRTPSYGNTEDLYQCIYILTDKTEYIQGETIKIQITNKLDEPIFLPGCNQYIIEKQQQSHWSWWDYVVCIWEGISVKIDSDSSLEFETTTDNTWLGTFRVHSDVSIGCQEDMRITEAECTDNVIIYSNPFTVITKDKPDLTSSASDISFSTVSISAATQDELFKGIFEDDLGSISEELGDIEQIMIDAWSGPSNQRLNYTVIKIIFSPDISDSQKVALQENLQTKLETMWYVRYVEPNYISCIPGAPGCPPWPGYVIGELIIGFNGSLRDFIEIALTVHNTGGTDAQDILVTFYDKTLIAGCSDQDSNCYNVIESKLIPSIGAGASIIARSYWDSASATSGQEGFCGSSTYGACETDFDCIKGGCSAQVCLSRFEEPIRTTCEWRECYDSDEYGVFCKCIDNKCQWASIQTHMIYIHVDPNNTISESDESNNQVYMQFTLPSFCLQGVDMNNDNEITPYDSMCMFQKYIGVCPTSCGECDGTWSDINTDGAITSLDALEIFKRYLRIESLLDEKCPLKDQQIKLEPPPGDQIGIDSQRCSASGEEVTFSVLIDNAPNKVKSFGFEIEYDPNRLKYEEPAFGDLVQGFTFKKVSNPEAGTLIIGGFDATTIDSGIPTDSSGLLVGLTFTAKKCETSTLKFFNLKDDIASWSAKAGQFIIDGQHTYYHDKDTDGYGDPNDFIEASYQPEGYVLDNTDCLDSNPFVNPGETEFIDGFDNNCDGITDQIFFPTFTETSVFLFGSITLNGINLSSEDRLGAYAPGPNNTQICIGSTTIDPNGTEHFLLATYGDDPTTPTKDGATAGDSLSFKLWDNSQKTHINLHPLYSQKVYWTMNGDVLKVDLINNYSQEIPLHTGWNLISFQVNTCFYDISPDPNFIPDGVEMIDVVNDLGHNHLIEWFLDDRNSPIRDADYPNKAGDWQRITSFDQNGAHLIDKDLPPIINTLHYMSLGNGYWIKMNKPGVLIFQRPLASPMTKLNLKKGWNLIGFIPHDICYGDSTKAKEDICPYMEDAGIYKTADNILYCPIYSLVETIFQGIEGKYKRITSFDTCSGALLYDTELPEFVNTLHYLGPKYGYWIKMEADAQMAFMEVDCLN